MRSEKCTASSNYGTVPVSLLDQSTNDFIGLLDGGASNRAKDRKEMKLETIRDKNNVYRVR